MKKYISFGLFAAFSAGFIVIACSKDKKSDAETAAEELCACYEKDGNEKDKCFDRFDEKWKSKDEDAAFQDELEKLADTKCGDKR
jgi:hypothetical protein